MSDWKRGLSVRTLAHWSLVIVGALFPLLFSRALSAAEPMFIRGDANSDSRVDIGDPIFTLAYSFRGERAPTCDDAADANDDGGIDISDAIYTLFFLFQGSKAPPAPYPAAGLDPTADPLTCGLTNPSGFGRLLVAIHDTPVNTLTEFWISIEHVSVDAADGTSQKVFPPAATPDAEKIVNLLDNVSVSSIISTIEVPAGDYTGVHIEFDHAFARVGADAVTVVPDSGTVNLTFAAPIHVTEGNLTALLVDFNLTASLSDGGPGVVTLDPVVVAAEDDENDGEEHDLGEFHGKVISVNIDAKTFVVEVTHRQHGGKDPAAAGQLTVAVDDATKFEHGDGLASLVEGQEVEVKGTLKDDGSILASKVELKGSEDGEDLNDDGVDDADEGDDHDSDIDNDGNPNVNDDDDDGDGVSDKEDADDDDDGIPDAQDPDDDNDGIPDAQDTDDDGDGIPDAEDNDVDDEDGDGTPDMTDDDDDGDGVMDDNEEDSDHDGVDNARDADDDNDGIPDDQDPDADGNGIPDDQEDDGGHHGGNGGAP